MTPTTTRKATASDLPQVLEMIHALAIFHGDTPTLDLKTLQKEAQQWVHIIVAEHGDTLVGYATMLPLAQLQFGARGYDIHHMFVREGLRGMGVGKALIGGCVEHAQAQGCKYVMVGTTPDNVAAQAAYSACGFERRDGTAPRFLYRL